MKKDTGYIIGSSELESSMYLFFVVWGVGEKKKDTGYYVSDWIYARYLETCIKTGKRNLYKLIRRWLIIWEIHGDLYKWKGAFIQAKM